MHPLVSNKDIQNQGIDANSQPHGISRETGTFNVRTVHPSEVTSRDANGTDPAHGEVLNAPLQDNAESSTSEATSDVLKHSSEESDVQRLTIIK